MWQLKPFLRALGALLVKTLILGSLAACQVDDFTAQYIRVKMLGVFEEPAELDNSEGSWVEPLSQTYTLQNVLMVSTSSAGEDEVHELYPQGSEEEFRIINRSQKIFEKKIDSDFHGLQINKFVLVFANSVKGISKYKSDHSLDLAEVSQCQTSEQLSEALSESDLSDSCVLEFNVDFTFTKGQNVDLVLQVQWESSVLRDDSGTEETMYPPSFAISVTQF